MPLCREPSSNAPEEGLHGLVGNTLHSDYQGAESSTALFRSSLVPLHLCMGRGVDGILVRDVLGCTSRAASMYNTDGNMYNGSEVYQCV